MLNRKYKPNQKKKKAYNIFWKIFFYYRIWKGKIFFIYFLFGYSFKSIFCTFIDLSKNFCFYILWWGYIYILKTGKVPEFQGMCSSSLSSFKNPINLSYFHYLPKQSSKNCKLSYFECLYLLAEKNIIE